MYAKISTVAAGIAALVACGGTSKETDDTDTTHTETDTPTTETAIPIPTIDTAMAYAAYVGAGTTSGGVYTGTESVVAIGLPTDQILCEWTWISNGVSPSAVAAPCTDIDGNICEFTVDVTLTEGAEAAGDCVGLFGETLGVDGGGPFPYGYIADYHYNGMGYGPFLMYYVASYTAWYGVGLAAFDEGAATFEYEWPIGYIAYAL